MTPAAATSATRAEAALGPPDELAHGDFEMVVRRLADDLAFGTDLSLFVGSGLEYAQSRPYEPGDPVKQIDWRITARLNRAYVKDYETLKRTSIYLVVDTSASMGVGSTRLTKHDLAVWIASAVGLVGQRRLSPVAVIGGGERQTRLLPSLRRSDLWQAIEPLRTGSLSERTRLAERLTLLDVRADRRSLVMVISDLHDPDAMGALRHMAQKHDCVAIHLTDPAEAGRLGAGFYLGQEAETGHTFLAHGRQRWNEAARIEDELIRSGVSALRLRTDEPFVAPLRHFLTARAASMRGRR
ncbi:MAG: DUF58 domain-containing protein [Phycisphaerales bacterium JB039]